MSLPKGLEKLKELFDDSKVVKTVPMRPEWAKLWADLKEVEKECSELEMKQHAFKRRFWAKVEEDTGIYQSMRMNTKENVIEVRSEDEE